jgi:hypothetical protein
MNESLDLFEFFIWFENFIGRLFLFNTFNQTQSIR